MVLIMLMKKKMSLPLSFIFDAYSYQVQLYDPHGTGAWVVLGTGAVFVPPAATIPVTATIAIAERWRDF